MWFKKKIKHPLENLLKDSEPKSIEININNNVSTEEVLDIILPKIGPELKTYIVYTPDYYHPASWDRLDPPEYGPDVVTIKAKNKREARIFAAKTKEMANWAADCRSDGKPPWYKFTVEEV